MTDVLEGSVPVHVANTVCNAGGKVLKAVDMSYKYGSRLRPSLSL